MRKKQLIWRCEHDSIIACVITLNHHTVTYTDIVTSTVIYVETSSRDIISVISQPEGSSPTASQGHFRVRPEDTTVHPTNYAHGSCLLYFVVVWHCSVMTSSKENIFRVTGHLCGEFTGEFPAQTKATDAELWCFFNLRVNKRLSRQS